MSLNRVGSSVARPIKGDIKSFLRTIGKRKTNANNLAERRSINAAAVVQSCQPGRLVNGQSTDKQKSFGKRKKLNRHREEISQLDFKFHFGGKSFVLRHPTT